MIRFCLRDDRPLEVIGTMKVLDKQLVVRRCPGCGEVIFWDDYEDIKDEKQRTLKVMQ